jgi:Tol biopolymer transport system component
LHRLIRLHLASGALDTVSTDTVDVYEPAAAPVGHAVVLRTLSRVNTRKRLRVVAGDGSNRATLTEAGAWVDTSPAWSVDESFIAFVRVEDGGATHLLRVVADGDSEPTPLTVGGFAVSGPAWHPDGRIVFSREGVITTVRSSGGPVSVLVQGDGFALDPTVSADGRRVVFVSDRTGNFELWSLFDPSGVGPGPYLH